MYKQFTQQFIFSCVHEHFVQRKYEQRCIFIVAAAEWLTLRCTVWHIVRHGLISISISEYDVYVWLKSTAVPQCLCLLKIFLEWGKNGTILSLSINGEPIEKKRQQIWTILKCETWNVCNLLKGHKKVCVIYKTKLDGQTKK